MPKSTEDRDTWIFQQYADYLNGIFNHTVTDSRLSVVKQKPPFSLITRFQNQKPLPLQLQPRSWLHFRQIVFVQSGSGSHDRIIVQEYRYTYSLSSNPDDEQAWVFRYDYSLVPEENIPHAHLHVNADMGSQQLRHTHFPTARLSIEQVICHLIIEYGVKSRNLDWYNCLARSHKDFVEKLSVLELHPFL